MVGELVGEDKDTLDNIVEKFTFADEGIHRHHRGVWDELDKLYHGYKALKDTYSNANAATGPRDRYPNPALLDAQATFGHELHIPYAFSIVETVLPRLLSNRPRMLVLPRNQESERNVENMRGLIDAQQSQINYELRVQEAAKSGLMYGLGVSKTYWRRAMVERSKVMKAGHVLRSLGHKWKVETVTEPLFDDPTVEAVNVRDFFWDPYATSIDDARWVIHRTWRDTRYILDKVGSGVWDYTPLELEDLDTGDAANRYQTAHRGPRQAQGMPNPSARDTDVHEVWEFHDRGCIITIVDRQWIVSSVRNEAWPGRLPFHCYRPTHVLNQFVGKGEIEPIKDLQYELNSIRTHRRWSAEMALNPVLFYSDGLVDPRKIKVGPGELNPVNGDPREMVWKLDIPDVPHSGYREVQELQADIERTSGISDSISGSDAGAAQTATGIQLVQAAANARIQLKTRRAEVELIREDCRHWGALNQRHILQEREIQVPARPTPDEPERRWAWLKLGPGELAGEFDYEPEGGSTTPENIPQRRQDAQIKLAALGQIGNMLDAQRWVTMILEDLGVKNPETYLAPDVHVPPQTLDLVAQMLSEAGMDPAQAQQLVEGALSMALDMEEQEQQGAQPPEEPAVG